MAFKCYPCIRGCGYVKALLGVVLVGLALYILGSTPAVLDCNKMRATCPRHFGELVDEITKAPGNHIRFEGKVNEYCDCVDSCLNYMTVYRRRAKDTVATNCFAISNAAGVPGDAANGRANLSATSTFPFLGDATCVTCPEASTSQDGLYVALTMLAAVCGLSLIITAGCEHLELKWHSTFFGIGVLVLDVVCFLLLVLATVLSVGGSLMVAEACDPDTFEPTWALAGKDSTNGNPDQAAIYASFFVDLVEEHMATGICREVKHLNGYAFLSCLGALCTFWSCMATFCVCMAFTDDGLDDHDDDKDAVELHELMFNK